MAKKTARKKSAAPKRRPAAKTTKPAKATSAKSAAKRPKKKAKAAASPAKRPRAAAKSTPRRSSSARLTVVPPPPSAESPASSEGKLTAKDIEQFRHMLLEKRAEISGDVTTLHDEALNKNRTDASGDLSSMPIHMADLGTDNYELEFTLGLIEGERAMLKEIDEALERIKNGTYGLCLATGQPIGKARLRAKPWAKYCYEYTLAQERGQARGL